MAGQAAAQDGPGARVQPGAPAPHAVGPALRWALWALAWPAGTALQLQQAALWPAAWLFALVAGALLLLAAAWRRRHQALPLALSCVAIAALAFGATSGRAAWRLADALPPTLEGRDLRVTGVVSGLPRSTLTGTRFVLEVEQAELDGRAVQVPQRLSLGWYRGPDEDALLGGPAEDLRAGQRWQLTLRLRQPHGTINPHGFDLELWLFERGIRASGYVRHQPATPARKLAEQQGQHIDRLRQDLRDAIGLQVPDASAAGMLAALVVGDQAGIERDDWDVFRATGIAHLVSISGLHVTMFAWLAAAAIGRLWRLQPRLMLALPAPVAGRWGGLLLAAAYALLAGWGVPAQRTVWMLATVAVLRSLGLRWPVPAVLLAAACVVTALDPWALLQPGFWLSFVAVGLLVAAEPVQPESAAPAGRWPRLQQTLRAGLRAQVVATVGLAPLSLVFFQQVSVVGFVANLVAIPLVTLLITPLALLGVAVPPLWTLAAALVQGLTALLHGLAGLPGAVWMAAAAPPWAMAAGLLGGLLAVAPLPPRLRWLALPLVLPLLAPPVPRPAPGQFETVVADIGQGTAVLVRTARHLLVYDAGPSYSREADAGLRVLLPLLRARGETQIDLLMISHQDVDHVGGAATLAAGMPVRQLSSSLVAQHPLRALGLPHQPCQAGQRWQWDGVQFEVLHPLAQDLAEPLKPNALSCVLRVQGAAGVAHSLLLTGDIEAAQEQALVARDAPALRSAVLLVPHHGSRTSSTPAFLHAVQPAVAVVQAGYRSRYGHPAPEVMRRYQAAGIQAVRSDECGAWTLPADGAAHCERLRARRYWHHPGRVDAAL